MSIPRIIEAELVREGRWISLWDVVYEDKNGEQRTWELVSRKEVPLAITEVVQPDAVIIIALYKGQMVLVREWRVVLGDFEVSCPAGLIDPGESIKQAARREFKEETGLDLESIKLVSQPNFSTAGLTDESSVFVIGEAKGEISTEALESTEELEVLLVDQQDCQDLIEASETKISSKLWPFLYFFAKTGEL